MSTSSIGDDVRKNALGLLLTRHSVQDVTMAVLDMYTEGGFEIVDEFRDLPDHISAELEFLYVLLFKAAQAERNRNPEALRAVSSLRVRFLEDHLGRWIEPFCAALSRGAETDFYRELASVTAQYVQMERPGSREP